MASQTTPGISASTTQPAQQQQEAQHVRPTEAQLRWSQFHHKRRAQSVKASYQKLWKTPLGVEDVEAAVPEDGASSTDTSDSAVRQIRARRRPKISKGRRALLRVSRRDYEKRRQLIATEGFQGGGNDADISIDDSADDGLDAIFAAPIKRKKKRGRTKGRQDDESFRRFQAACHAMMMNLQAAPEITIDTPEKIWKPSEHHMNAEEIENEYRKHLLKHAGMENGSSSQHPFLPMDRGASWMTHLPHKNGAFHNQLHPFYNFTASGSVGAAGGDYPYQYPASQVGRGDDDNVSQATASTLALHAPGRHKFTQLLAMVQQQVIARSQEEAKSLVGVPTMRLKQNPDNFTDHGNDDSSAVSQQDQHDVAASPPKMMRLRSEFNDSSQVPPSPRMKLKEFTTVDPDDDDDDNFIRRPSDLPDKQRLPPTMRLRESYEGQEDIIATTPNAKNTSLNNYTPVMMKLTSPPRHPGTATPGRANNYQNATPGTLARMRGTPSPALRDFTVARSDSMMFEKDALTPNTMNMRSVNYTPRMKLQEFKPNSKNGDDDNDQVDEEADIGVYVEDEKKVNESPMGKTEKSSKAISDRFMNMYGKGSKTSVSPAHRTDVPGDTDAEGKGAFLAISPLNRVYKGDSSNMQDRLDDMELSPMHPAVPPKKKSTRKKKDELPQEPIPQDPPHAELSDEKGLTGLWSKGRTSLQAAFDSTLNSIPESDRSSTGQPMSAPANIKAKVEHANERVGNFFNKLRGQKKEGNEHIEYDEDDMIHHLAGFRKSQEQRRESMSPEDTSSVSSFRVLPEGIRSVVKSMYRNSSASQTSESPSRSTTTRSSAADLSTGQSKEVQDRFVKEPEIVGNFEPGIIDTDETTSQASGTGMDPRVAASLMMSPTLLNKRLKQAVKAVEKCNWEQVSYLIHANPWLAEMSELTTGQTLLHKVAYYSGSQNPCPEKLNLALLDMFPSAVHKFDSDGNLPLHLAAASRNFKMIRVLGERFESGASVRNEDGMLPIHFAIAAFAVIDTGDYGDQAQYNDRNPSPLETVKTVLRLFPKAVAITDNDGNLPIHICAEALEPPFGVDVAFLLLDEADRQVSDPYGARFYNRVKVEEFDETGAAAMRLFERETDSMVNMDDRVHCTVVRNEFGETPLLTAIRSGNSWEMIEAIVCAPGGDKAALMVDADKNTALHHLVGPEFGNAAGAMSVLKIAPEAASMRNSDGMLAVEIACMQGMPHEVIFALVLVDLPIEIDQKVDVKVRDGFGDSWWYLACECDDHYVDVVKQVLSMCTFLQIRELCFMKRGYKQSGTSVISLASPKCRRALTRALRFLGRFEFMGNGPVLNDPSIGLQEFDALDFGDRNSTSRNEQGKRVLLKCFSNEQYFDSQVCKAAF